MGHGLKIDKVIVTEPIELHSQWCLDTNKKNCHLGSSDAVCRIVIARFTVYTSDWTCIGEIVGSPMRPDDWESRCYHVARAVKAKLGKDLTITD